MRILIVDDDPIDVALIKRTLEKGSTGKLDIHSADSVENTINAIETQTFDVVLVDYKMPETNGIELIYKIRSLAHARDVAIILMSALEDQDVVIQSLEAGAQDFLPKRDVNQIKLHQAIMQAQKRFELEQKLQTSYLAAINLAERDALTGLYNRYYFDENLKMMMAGARRSGHSLALLAIDVDNFKYVNDTYGHRAGDQLLTQIVKRIGNCLRECDVFARLGGDEFAVIISDVHRALIAY